jgi:Fe-S oxidoreductase
MGNEYLYQSVAAENIERIKNYGVRQIVTSCPFCLTMFEDGVKGAELENSLAARDATEIPAARVVAG